MRTHSNNMISHRFHPAISPLKFLHQKMQTMLYTDEHNYKNAITEGTPQSIDYEWKFVSNEIRNATNK